MPSVNWTIYEVLDKQQAAVLAITNTPDASWLNQYIGQFGLTMPFILDAGSELFNLFQVGGPSGNVPPTYIIIDTDGRIIYRTDDTFGETEAMKTVMEDAL